MTVQQIRDAEARAMRSVTEAELMARAADAVAAECEAVLLGERGRLEGASVVALVGQGNNGGDALLTAARLAHRGATATALLVTGKAHEPSLAEAQQARVAVIDAHLEPGRARTLVEGADLVIDGIVGIGSKPGLRSPADALVTGIREDATVVAVDIPSGLDADSAAAEAPHVAADVTVTFTALKACLADDPARASAGRIIVAQVGVPRS